MDTTDTLLTILVALLMIIIVGMATIGVILFIAIRKTMKKLDKAMGAANGAALIAALGLGKKLGLLRLLRLLILKR